MSELRGNKTRFARRRVYTVSAQTVGLPFFTCKCDVMHLRWVFTVENAVVLMKNVFEFTLIRLEGFNNKISLKLACVFHVAFASFFFFSFSFHFRYNSFVMFLYIAYIF